MLSTDFKEYQMKVGELATETESFCSFQSIKRYPFMYMGNTNRQKVVEAFFDQGKIYEHTWDL